jgi:hypothetical protein
MAEAAHGRFAAAFESGAVAARLRDFLLTT